MSVILYLMLALIGCSVFTLRAKNESGNYSIKRSLVFTIITLCLSGFFVYSFTNSSDFLNNEYHALEHKGFAFTNNINFIDGDTNSNSVFISDKTKCSIRKVAKGHELRVSSYLPFYIRNKDENYVLINNNNNKFISDKLECQFSDSGNTYSLSFEEIIEGEDKKLDWELRLNNEVIGKGNYSHTIKKGSGLLNLFHKSDSVSSDIFNSSLDDNRLLIDFLSESIVVRDIQNKTDKSKVGLSFFPAKGYYNDVTINGQNYSPTNKVVEINEDYERFYWGFDYNNETVFELISDSNISNVQFYVPIQYPLVTNYNLSNGDEVELFIYSNEDSLLNTSITKGLLLNFNPNNLKLNNDQVYLNGSLKFKASHEKELNLELLANGQSWEIEDNTEFLVPHLTNDIQWVLKNRNFRVVESPSTLFRIAHNPYLPMVVIFLFLIALFFLIAKDRNELSSTYLIIGHVLIHFYVLRSIISWRLRVFPPLVDKHNFSFKKTTLNLYVDSEYDLWLLGVPMPIIIIGIIVGLICLIRKKNIATVIKNIQFRNIRKKIINCFASSSITWQFIISVFTLIICYIIGQLWEGGHRFSYIILPTATYFIYQYLSTKVDFKDLFHRTLNWLIHLIFVVFFFVTDAGFGFIFICYLLIYQLIHLTLKAEKKSWPQIFIAIVAVLVFFVFNKKIFSLLFTYNFEIMIGLIFVFIILFVYLFIKPKYKEYKTPSMIIGFLFILGFVAAIIRPSEIKETVNDKIKNTKYRTEVVSSYFEDKNTLIADKLISKQDYQSRSINIILREIKNQWFLNRYNQSADNFYLSKQLSLKKHFDRGVNYKTQTNDVIVSRFLIAEWSYGGLVILILCLALVLRFLFVRKSLFYFEGTGVYAITKLNRNYKLQVSLFTFLFCNALFVFMTNIGKLPFFGQDFPMLSNSALSIVLPFFILASILFISISETESNRAVIGDDNIKRNKKTGRVLLFVIFLFIFIFGYNSYTSIADSNYFRIDIPSYRTYVNELKNNYKQWERGKQDPLLPTDSNGSRKAQIDMVLKNQLTDFIRDRGEAMKQIFNIDSLRTNYNQSVYEALCDTVNFPLLNQSNTPLLFTRRTYLDDNKRTRVSLNFSYNNTWNENPPPHLIKEWKGNILAQDKSLNAHSSDRQEIMVDASWTKNSESYTLIGDAYSKNVKKEISKNEEGIKTYLAKNLFVNGKQRLVYPEGTNFIWAYNFSNEVKNTTIAKSTDLKTSLDLELQQEVTSILNNNISSKESAVIIANSSGNILVMADRKVKPKLEIEQLNPNSTISLYKVQKQQELYPNYEINRYYFSNLNLLHCDLGPGSTLKPIIFSAVTSQKFLNWQTLSKNEFPFTTSYAGQDLRRIYQKESSRIQYFTRFLDQNNNRTYTANPTDYLAKSDNYYNSIMLFLGSYSADDFDWLLDSLQNCNNHPYFRINNRQYSLPDLSIWPRDNNNQFFSKRNSLLAFGLKENFDLQVDDPNDRIQYFGRGQFKSIFEKPSRTSWAFPERSRFLQNKRNHIGPGGSGNPLNEGIRQSTMGGDPWHISPYKMVEMIGKLYTANNNFKLSILDKDSVLSYSVFDTSDWENNSYDAFVRDNIIAGMEKSITDGTSSMIRNLRNEYLEDDIYIYSKTGTPGKKNRSDKTFIVVLSNKNLQTESRKDAKMFFIYFTDYHHFSTSKKDEKINRVIRALIESNKFKKYMQ